MVKTAKKFRSPDREERWISERIFVRETMNHPEFPDYSIAACRVPVGVTTQLHSLSVDETYIIRRGIGKMEKGGSPAYEVIVGDCVHIPAGISQRITNIGPDDLEFDTICTPRFEDSCYTALE